MADVPAQPQRKLVVIEDGLLLSMAANAAFIAAFPFLTALQSPQIRAGSRGGCGSCGSKNNARNSALLSAKANLANMDVDSKRRLKEMLNAQQVRIIYQDGNLRTIAKTF
jgi:hypothetical protein